MNPKRKRFVAEYLKTGADGGRFNATQAALNAGYSERSAATQGSALLQNAEVQAAIAKAQEQVQGEAVMSFDEACQVLTRMVRADLRDYYNDRGMVDEMTCGDTVAIAEVVRTRRPTGEYTTKFKLVDKIRAIERLSKLLGWDKPTKVAPTDPSGDNPYKLVNDEELQAIAQALANGHGGDKHSA